MRTPICDFVNNYAEGNALRLHMPGHKGISLLGMEKFDITEICGADSLYEADGIIRESEINASTLFGCPTFYSTEGSSQCIRAMLHLATIQARRDGRKPLIAAGRNAHKTFLSAAALLDLDVFWLVPDEDAGYLSCPLHADQLEQTLHSMPQKPDALYITSPDYLGNTADITALAEVCHRQDVLLLVDNAHGAYLKFLPESRHPMDLGADLCCDSAHKTLPVLTGGAYLHISPALPEFNAAQVKNAMALFGSTSPSYLILQSLDAVNRYLADGYREKLARFCPAVDALKKRLIDRGFRLQGDEPMKITLRAKDYGYRGTELAEVLEVQNIIPEFADPDFLVLMLTPETGLSGLARLEEALTSLPCRNALPEPSPAYHACRQAMSIRQAMLSASEILPVENCIGRILAGPSVGCPPAVPILVCGEIIDDHAVQCFRYYGIESCSVVLE